MIYVNLSVRDLARSKAFFASLGFDFNPQFTNDAAACMRIADNIHTMLLTEPHFKTFTDKQICDTSKSTEVLLCLSCDSRKQVDEMVAKAKAAGGRILGSPKDHGFMYIHSFEDLDGHTWELAYMEEMPPA